MKRCKREGKEQSKVVLSHIQICVLPKQKTQQVEGWGSTTKTERCKRVSVSLTQRCNRQSKMLTVYSWTCVPRVPKVLSRILYLWSRTDPRMPLMAWNVPKCSYTSGEIQTCQEKSPKSGQYCTQGKWTTLVQTDLISGWFTTSNHSMSQRHHHIIHSFIFFPALRYNKSR